MNRFIIFLSIMLLASTLSSCNKDARTREAILGAWVSVDLADTLVFLNEERFEKNFYPGVMELFGYSIDRDSITVKYSGSYYIAVSPSTHYLEVEDNALIIDFSNGCFGFPMRKMYFYSTELE